MPTLPQNILDLPGQRRRIQGHIDRLKAHITALESHLDAGLPAIEAAQVVADTAIRVATSVTIWDAHRRLKEQLDG